MTRVEFRRTLATTPDVAWELLTNPERMIEWSVAPITVPPGTDARTVGGKRVVHVRRFGVPVTLHELTVRIDAPRTYEYVVRPNLVVRRHAAIQRLAPVEGGTLLEWDVDIRAWIPGLMTLLVRAMRVQLEASLDQLERCARDVADGR